jgi:phenylalanyl-tRNA synthetase beta chain
LTYSLIPESEEKIQEDEEYYSLIKPKSEKHYKYRQSLINSHLEVINYNLSRKNCNLFFFEISSVYKKKAEKLFHEDILILSGCGKKIEQKFHKEIIDFDFFWMKGIVEELLAFLRIPDNSYYFEKCENTKIGIFINGKKIGSIVRKTDKIFFSELILTEIDNFRKNEKEKYREISSFPYSEKDITIEVNGDVNYKKMIELINEKSNQELLRRTELLDVYVDSRMKKEGKKSVSLRMIFQRNDRTIKREEIEREIKTILFFLKKDFSAKLR